MRTAHQLVLPRRGRLAEFSFEPARAEGIGDVVLVHKANIMRLTDDLLHRSGQEVAASYPNINCRSTIADAMAMQLVKAPERYRMLVCGNLFSDLLSDLSTGLVGGPLASRVTGHGDDGLTVYHTILNAALREARPARGRPRASSPRPSRYCATSATCRQQNSSIGTFKVRIRPRAPPD